MRIRGLDLLKYGHFSNTDFDLPASRPDLNLVFGLNEAGKSTALCAIEDVLFGIPQHSPHNFLHDYASMRIGARIESDGRSLEFRRRKGLKHTLLTRNEVPMHAGNSALAAFLGGADRGFFGRMFCLDHARLRQGGREILEAQDDVGQILYSASAGIVGLREQIAKMNGEADALWAKRASQRKFNAADQRLKAADQALREHTVTANQWHDLRTALDTAVAACSELESEVQNKTAEERRLNRIRRVCRHVRQREQLVAALGTLGDVTELAEAASQVLHKALNYQSTAAARLETIAEQIDGLARERNALAFDAGLLPHADDINRLHERRIQIHAGIADLPKRRAELAVTVTHLKRLATELAWRAQDPDEITSRIPARAKLAHARALANRRGELLAAESNARTGLEEADERVQSLQSSLDECRTLTDLRALSATIAAARESGDVTARAIALEAEAIETQQTIERSLAALRPQVADASALAAMTVPPKAAIEAHRDGARRLNQAARVCRDRIDAAERDLLRHRTAYERMAREEHAVPSEEVQRQRAHRDAGWSIIRRKYIDGSDVPDGEILAFASDQNPEDAYETAVAGADEVADRRFEKAEMAGQLAATARQISEMQEMLHSFRGEEQALATQIDTMQGEWNELWAASGLNPLGPDAMLEWVELRSQIRDMLARCAAMQHNAGIVRTDETNTRDLLLSDLKALGVGTDSLADRPLRVIIQFGCDVQRQHADRAVTRRTVEENLRKATIELARKRRRLEAAQADIKAWEAQWTVAIESLALNPAAPPETLDAHINAIDEIREVASRVNDLRHERIGKIERDIAAFNHEVGQTLRAIAPELADLDEQGAVVDLERRLAEAKTGSELAAALDQKLREATQKAEQCVQMQHDARESIQELQRAAAVSSIEQLQTAIDHSDRYRSLRRKLESANQTLVEDGDGLGIDDVVAECAAANVDDIAAREQSLGEELKELRERLMQARESQAEARRQLEAVGGSDRAARAAADRQAALTEMTEVAENYVKVRSAVLLLQWAVERYRRQKQAPLLKRAGALFSMLTGASFSHLQLEFDEHDKMLLTAVRADGRTAPVHGMSTGTADQLYLALRVAAVEDYLTRGVALPFIADDLFINFDDDRAGAGFRVLAELAQKTQVLFFTHHQHLLGVAKGALGRDVPVISLEQTAPARHDSRQAA